MKDIILIVLIVVGTALGLILGYYLRKVYGAKQKDSAEAKIKESLDAAKSKQKELELNAKNKAIAIIDDAKKEEVSRRHELTTAQKRLEQREEKFDKKILELEDKQQKLFDKANSIEQIKKQIGKIKNQQIEKLESVAGLKKEDALNVLLELIEKKNKETVVSRIRKMENESSEELEKKAKDILAVVVQRTAISHASESTTTVVSLPTDEMKGRIIGREGRNIKTIEQLTGVEIIVDDTPGAIIVSGFSPIRRHLAKKTLEKLIQDGRIHPTKIEGAIEESKKELSLEIRKAGEEALFEVGVTGLDPKLVQIIGRLKYRTSYGQNALRHSIEVCFLSALLAEQLGGDVAVAKKAGILHDIGKAVDHEIQGTHPEIGRDIAKKFNLPDEIIQPILTHHDDKPPTLESVIVKVADAISGARPGARKDTYEKYLQRLSELEDVANSFEGVEKSYAIQAGREVRVFVRSEQVDDLGAQKMAESIAKKVEEELKYPGEIKVNVIRETRVTEYAR